MVVKSGKWRSWFETFLILGSLQGDVGQLFLLIPIYPIDLLWGKAGEGSAIDASSTWRKGEIEV